MLHSESPCAFLNPLDLLRYSPKPGAVPVCFAWLRQVRVRQNGGQLGNSSEICGFELIKHAQMFDHAPTGRRGKTRRDAEDVSLRVSPHIHTAGANLRVIPQDDVHSQTPTDPQTFNATSRLCRSTLRSVSNLL